MRKESKTKQSLRVVDIVENEANRIVTKPNVLVAINSIIQTYRLFSGLYEYIYPYEFQLKKFPTNYYPKYNSNFL